MYAPNITAILTIGGRRVSKLGVPNIFVGSVFRVPGVQSTPSMPSMQPYSKSWGALAPLAPPFCRLC